MNSLRTLSQCFVALCLLATTVFAAETSPAGLWKWTVQGRQGGQGFDQSLKLEYKEGKLSGVMLGRNAGQFSVPDTAIDDASFKDGEIAFSITREFNSQKFTTRYQGKLEGDTIKGTFERPAMGKVGASSSPWEARRQK